MSRYNPASAELKKLLPIVAFVGIPTIGVGMIADNYIDPLLIWGGSECEPVNGVLGCFGYPPAGIGAIALVVGVAVAAGFAWLSNGEEAKD